jgi:putative peptidoglycan binding protein
MPTGDDLIGLARKHLGEPYVFGVLAPKDNAGWKGPWDCAEFVSWLVFRVTGLLYGCDPADPKPSTTNAYTGYWANDASARGRIVPWSEAAGIPGAAVLRVPGAIGGHIVVSDGAGGTVEAHSSRRGVIRGRLAGRVWDMGILVPGIVYAAPATVTVAPPRTVVYRVTEPRMTGPTVKAIQRALKRAGFVPGDGAGVYGPHTQAAVFAFQGARRLTQDGEVGPATAKALRVKLPAA